ncbi:ring finger domain protein [Puccinia sorghi]|uniref:Ring finger domain protein n=1 Tax=Puccinia sorghi TaxID=27349 RepID=A0A0L6VMY2_9BASI|nr:ring finger domain protein [Puccinia sorghi]
MIDFIGWSHLSNSTWFMRMSFLLPPFLKNYITLNHAINQPKTRLQFSYANSPNSHSVSFSGCQSSSAQRHKYFPLSAKFLIFSFSLLYNVLDPPCVLNEDVNYIPSCSWELTELPCHGPTHYFSDSRQTIKTLFVHDRLLHATEFIQFSNLLNSSWWNISPIGGTCTWRGSGPGRAFSQHLWRLEICSTQIILYHATVFFGCCPPKSGHGFGSWWEILLQGVSWESCSQILWLNSLTLQTKLAQLPAADMQHAPAKLPSKLHMFAYVDFLAHSLNSRSFRGTSACQLQEVEQSFHYPVYTSKLTRILFSQLLNKILEKSRIAVKTYDDKLELNSILFGRSMNICLPMQIGQLPKSKPRSTPTGTCLFEWPTHACSWFTTISLMSPVIRCLLIDAGSTLIFNTIKKHLVLQIYSSFPFHYIHMINSKITFTAACGNKKCNPFYFSNKKNQKTAVRSVKKITRSHQMIFCHICCFALAGCHTYTTANLHCDWQPSEDQRLWSGQRSLPTLPAMKHAIILGEVNAVGPRSQLASRHRPSQPMVVALRCKGGGGTQFIEERFFGSQGEIGGVAGGEGSIETWEFGGVTSDRGMATRARRARPPLRYSTPAVVRRRLVSLTDDNHFLFYCMAHPTLLTSIIPHLLSPALVLVLCPEGFLSSLTHITCGVTINLLYFSLDVASEGFNPDALSDDFFMMKKLFQVIVQIAFAPRSYASCLSNQLKVSAEVPSLKAVPSFPVPVWALRGSELPKAHAKNLLRSCLIILPFGGDGNDGFQRSTEDCPICFSSLAVGNAEQWSDCGHNFHSACLQRWRITQLQTGQPATCPTCRGQDPTTSSYDATNQFSALCASCQVVTHFPSFTALVLASTCGNCGASLEREGKNKKYNWVWYSIGLQTHNVGHGLICYFEFMMMGLEDSVNAWLWNMPYAGNAGRDGVVHS